MMSDSKRSLALAITLQGVDAPHDFRRQVRRVEALGYTHLWLTDSSLHARYVYAYLTLAAVDTERLWLGTGVTHPFTRHPAMTVNAIATLDEISNGRAILGLGAGDRPTGELGFAPARLKDMRAMTRVARGLLNGETLDLQSDHFQLKGAQLHFEHRSNLAIYMFCSGPRMLSLAGEVADGVVAQCGVFPGAVDFAREKVAEGAARAGRSMDDIDMWVMACGALSKYSVHLDQ